MKKTILKVLVVLVPSYAMAYLTEKMVYVIPMLAAGLIIASAIGKNDEETEIRLDEDGGVDG